MMAKTVEEASAESSQGLSGQRRARSEEDRRVRLVRVREDRGVGLEIDGGRIDATEQRTEVVVRRVDALVEVGSVSCGIR